MDMADLLMEWQSLLHQVPMKEDQGHADQLVRVPQREIAVKHRLADVFLQRVKHRFKVVSAEHLPGFWSVFGFVACTLVVVVHIAPPAIAALLAMAIAAHALLIAGMLAADTQKHAPEPSA